MFVKRTVMFILAALFVAAPAFGEPITRIGVVDLQRVLNTSTAGKDATATLNTKSEQYQKILQEKGEELQELQKNFERKMMVLNEDKRMEMQRELRIKMNDLKLLEAKYTQELKRQEGAFRSAIIEEVIVISEEMGKKKGYTMVVDRQEAGVIYVPEEDDITDQVIATYNLKKGKEAQ